MKKKYFLFCDTDIEVMFYDNDYSIQDICNHIDENSSRCELFVWTDGESNPEELLTISEGFMSYIILDEEEYNLVSQYV